MYPPVTIFAKSLSRKSSGDDPQHAFPGQGHMKPEQLKIAQLRHELPPDLGERQAVAPNVLDRGFDAPAPNRKCIADFTHVWTAEGWLYVAAVIDLLSRRVGRLLDERRHD